MRNKWFVSLLMVVVIMCACWTGVLAEDEERETFTSGDYEYALLDDGTIEITKYNGSTDHLAIPATLDGKTVTAIGDYAFARCSSLTSVSIPDSVTSFGDGAFFACDSLTSITIPDSVVQIGENPFTSCSSLKIISVSPEHLYFAAIDGVLFRKADKALISYPAGIKSPTYTIPQGITSIGVAAFSRCKSLTSITIPDSVTSIRDWAFSSCDSLTSITIPDSVTSIGVGAFESCYSLTSITIPDSVTSIGDWAFASCNFLTSVTIPDSVTSIGDGAFLRCSFMCSSNLTLTVPRNSYAAEYAKTNNIPYTYPDANDWLNN